MPRMDTDTIPRAADPDWEWRTAAEDTAERLASLWQEAHVGHADLIRESVDGLVGEDPE